MTVKLKVTLPNIVIKGESVKFAISKIELFVAIALHWKPLTFVAESSILDRLACNLDPRSSSKVWLYNYQIDSYLHIPQ